MIPVKSLNKTDFLPAGNFGDFLVKLKAAHGSHQDGRNIGLSNETADKLLCLSYRTMLRQLLKEIMSYNLYEI